MTPEGADPYRPDVVMTTAELGRNLAKLEHKVDLMETKMDAGFRGVQESIFAASATYLRLDLYMSQRESDRADIEAIRKLAQWSFGIIVSTTLGAIVLGIVSASSAF